MDVYVRTSLSVRPKLLRADRIGVDEMIFVEWWLCIKCVQRAAGHNFTRGT